MGIMVWLWIWCYGDVVLWLLVGVFGIYSYFVWVVVIGNDKIDCDDVNYFIVGVDGGGCVY